MNRLNIATLALCGALALGRVFAAESEVQVAEFSLQDAQRDRQIECRSYAPKNGDKLPLIVFSHGFGADLTAFAPIAQHWAAHGYVVVAPSHLDGSGKRGQGGPTPVGGLSALMANAALKTENRLRDVTFILDAIGQIEDRVPSLRGRIDSTRIGVAGHSLGAYTAMLVGGVTVDINALKSHSFRDSRVRCVLSISGQGIGQQGLSTSSWSALSIPMLSITGSLDRGAGGQGPEWKKQSFDYSPPGDKYLVFIDGANHFSFGGTKAGDITESVKACTLSFWEGYLKDVSEAKTSLKDGSVLDTWKYISRISAK